MLPSHGDSTPPGTRKLGPQLFKFQETSTSAFSTFQDSTFQVPIFHATFSNFSFLVHENFLHSTGFNLPHSDVFNALPSRVICLTLLQPLHRAAAAILAAADNSALILLSSMHFPWSYPYTPQPPPQAMPVPHPFPHQLPPQPTPCHPVPMTQHPTWPSHPTFPTPPAPFHQTIPQPTPTFPFHTAILQQCHPKSSVILNLILFLNHLSHNRQPPLLHIHSHLQPPQLQHLPPPSNLLRSRGILNKEFGSHILFQPFHL